MTDFPEDIMEAADAAMNAVKFSGDPLEQARACASAILAERSRCAGVANERAAQLRGVRTAHMDPGLDAYWSAQLTEALLIEQRIAQGHAPKERFEVEGLHPPFQRHS